MSSVTAAQVFAASPIVPVMVIKHVEDALPLAKALADGGITVFEITLRTDAALGAIKAISDAMPEAIVGAGTIINPEQFDDAVNAGAQFIISPGFSPELLEHSLKHQTVPYIPGVATASEMITALSYGLDHLKFFPAEANGGAPVLKAVSAALPQITFCPTGGVKESNLSNYLSLPCVGTVGGTWMIPQDAIEAKQWDKITELSKQAVELVASLRG
ncbi:bifunctional 4-hydroxy-2-oxoglutarate aldolase/2-dehydro-3-deoxy-phosphogluconate aldolase [Celerinatantimonas sp. YJH-8]|uniref:bifunctional 4-hydroxy-2-oxoglutarate aldolase/2-dehydro-3-deoxy-phosphogluconate aldolase n=1 Tax=Celerinatantimonas sp. YJH-8 TaxID=3228714 RepID=UPI0038BF18AD